MVRFFNNYFRLVIQVITLAIFLTHASVFGTHCFASQSVPFISAITAAVSDTAKITRSFQGSTKSPVVIFEERHDSRVAQIQQAIVLVRLHEKHGLNKIVLEGYLHGDDVLDVRYFIKASKSNMRNRAEVACTLLKEGEISSAEFMKLVYDKVIIYPSENIQEYDVELDDEAFRAPSIYLLKIAQSSLTNADLPEINRITKKIQGESDKQRKEVHIQELLDYILSRNSWVKEMYDFITVPHTGVSISIEKHLSKMKEIANYPSDNGLQLNLKQSEIDAMQRNLNFWELRSKASLTMLGAAQNVRESSDREMIAMVIGAAHTDLICNKLKKNKVTFAVVTPLSLYKKSKKGDLSSDMLERKYKRASVFSEGIYMDLLTAYPPSKNKKPNPVLPEDWFKAKSELYLFTHQITNDILGPPNPPGGGRPPYEFSDDRFDGNFVYIDPARIEIIDGDRDNVKTVLFPVVLNNKDAKLRSTIWVKAAIGRSVIQEQDELDVESMLKRALEGIDKESARSKKSKDINKVIQLSDNIIAVMTRDKGGAQNSVLRGS